jgi:transcriptional regulator with XRE-family HTH domain
VTLHPVDDLYPVLSEAEARTLTDRIRQRLGDLREDVAAAYHGRAHEALGYPDWQTYVVTEFPMLPRLGQIERGEWMQELRKAGMTQREIGATVGIDHRTVGRSLGANAPGVRPSDVDDGKDQQIRDLRAQGVKHGDIAAQLHVSKSRIAKVARESAGPVASGTPKAAASKPASKKREAERAEEDAIANRIRADDKGHVIAPRVPPRGRAMQDRVRAAVNEANLILRRAMRELDVEFARAERESESAAKIATVVATLATTLREFRSRLGELDALAEASATEAESPYGE